MRRGCGSSSVPPAARGAALPAQKKKKAQKTKNKNKNKNKKNSKRARARARGAARAARKTNNSENLNAVGAPPAQNGALFLLL